MSTLDIYAETEKVLCYSEKTTINVRGSAGLCHTNDVNCLALQCNKVCIRNYSGESYWDLLLYENKRNN
jgi:hypothetical protein